MNLVNYFSIETSLLNSYVFDLATVILKLTEMKRIEDIEIVLPDWLMN